MSEFINSPNMSMPVPQVAEAPGPDWATLLNSCLAILDSHTHAAGSGVLITPGAISITSDLPFGGFNATALRSTRYTPQSSPIAEATDLGCLYVSGVDLYFNDVSGNQIRITNNGSISGTSGSITGLVAPASASYNSISKTFVWQSDVSTPANLDAASVIFRKVTASSPGITVQVPSAIASSYSLVWPALPSSEAYVTLDASGNFLSSTPKNRSYIPTGTMMPIGTASVPSGWLACDGSAVSRTTYADLFSTIGTTYGAGDTTTTFNVPDFRGLLLTKTIAAKFSGNAPNTTNGNPIIFPTVDYDTTASYDNSTGEYTAPLTGYYQILAFFITSSTNAYVATYVNGTLVNRISFMPSGLGIMPGTTTVYLEEGDILTLRASDGSIDTDATTYVTINRLPGPTLDANDPQGLSTGYIIKT